MLKYVLASDTGITPPNKKHMPLKKSTHPLNRTTPNIKKI